jgi:hypothetical protein
MANFATSRQPAWPIHSPSAWIQVSFTARGKLPAESN